MADGMSGRNFNGCSNSRCRSYTNTGTSSAPPYRSRRGAEPSNIGVAQWSDDQLGDTDVRRQAGHEQDGGGDVLGLEDLLAVLLCNWLRPLLEDGRVHLAGEDAADANAVGLLLGRQGGGH